MQASRKIRLVVAVLAVLLVAGIPVRHARHFVRRHCVHARAMTADVVPTRAALSPFALASGVLPALPALGHFRPASAGLHQYSHTPLSPPNSRPPPRLF